MQSYLGIVFISLVAFTKQVYLVYLLIQILGYLNKTMNLRPRTTGGGFEGVLRGWVHDGKNDNFKKLSLRYRLTPYKLQFSVTFFYATCCPWP